MEERKGPTKLQINLRDSFHSDSDADGHQVKPTNLRHDFRFDPVHCHPNHLTHVHRDGITYWRDDNKTCYGKSCSCDEMSTSGITTDVDAPATFGCLHLAGVFPREVQLTGEGEPIELLLSLHSDNRRHLSRNEFVTVQLFHADGPHLEVCKGYFDQNPYSVTTAIPKTWREPGLVWLKIVRRETGFILGLGRVNLRSPQQQQHVVGVSVVANTPSGGCFRGQLLSGSEFPSSRSPSVSNTLGSPEVGSSTGGNRESFLESGLRREDFNDFQQCLSEGNSACGSEDEEETTNKGTQRIHINSCSVDNSGEKCGKLQISSQEITNAKEIEATKPTDTGLNLPPTGELSSVVGMKLLLEWRSGTITEERAIEEFRDEWNTSQTSSKQRKIDKLSKKIGTLRKHFAKLKLPFAREEGVESTSPDENDDGTKREKREMKKKPGRESEKIRERMFTVSSNETNTSEITRSSEDTVSSWSDPEGLKGGEDRCTAQKKTVSLPRNARLLQKLSRVSPWLQDGVSLDSGVFCPSPTGKGPQNISDALKLADE